MGHNPSASDGQLRQREQLQEKYEVYKCGTVAPRPLPAESVAALRAYSFVKKYHMIDSPELIFRASDIL